MNGHGGDQRRVTSWGETRFVDDADAMAGLARDGLWAEFVQLDSTRFRGRWTTVYVGGIVVQFGSPDTPVACRIRVPAARWAFIVGLDVSLAARWNGHPVRPWQILVCPPESEWRAFGPPSTRFAIVTADGGTPPADAARRLIASDGTVPVFAGCGARGLLLADRLTALCETVESGTAPAGGPDDSLDRLLAACLQPAAGRRAQPASVAISSQVVCRAEAHLERHLDAGISMATLSMVTGVSERRLRDAFYEVYAISPKRYMKLWRLHRVRRTLRQRGRVGLTVTEAAVNHGFSELGRFAGEYRAVFGEAPSQTLHRAKVAVGTRPGAAFRSVA